ncbi:MAG TPA: ankyrin repeat domain-containing protein [Pyrinomonadaceae bacterium]
MQAMIYLKNVLLIISLASLFACAACKETNVKPTPDESKGALKLRGYDYDEKSFLRAASTSDEVAVSTFIAAGMSPNVQEPSTGGSALISAATRGDLDMVNALLRGGADVNQKDEKGFTALLRALQNDREEIANLLVARPELEVNAQGQGGANALISFVARQRTPAVVDLLNRGANVNLQDSEGDTALNIAVQRGNVDLVNLLLNKGADPNIKNKLGGTPLMWAGVFGRKEIAQILLDKGADPRATDVDGMTAAAWAAKNNRQEMVEFLREAEKKR